ncbi:hypothetical protein KR044_000574 [Drosophila immigrans]|nr:hypothetical protein KR044_000574 [Drosophila immigrans]
MFFAMNVTWDSVNKIWSGPVRSSMYKDDASVGRIIFNTMRNYPKKVIQISDTDGIVVTNEEAITWAIRIAQHLKQRGLDHRNVIGVVGRNTTYVMPMGVACLLNGTPFHGVNPIFDEETLKYMYGITKPSLIFCDAQFYDKVKAATLAWAPEIILLSGYVEDVLTIESLLTKTVTENFYQPEPLRDGSDQTIAILCSSGTTGPPKAVCVSNNVLVQDTMLVNAETIFFITSGLDWISGLWAFLFSTFFGSTRIITDQPFSPEYFVKLVRKYKVNYATLAPVHLAAIAACKEATPFALASMRDLNYGGGILPQSVLKRIQELFKDATYNSAYAMSEVGIVTMSFGIKNAATAGRPNPGIKIRIVDETGKRLSHNEVGEIYVHTGKRWNGYYGNPVATRQMQDFEGWIHTGDLGYFDEDNYLYIVDRKKETLKYMGIHYWPTEIENAVLELPQVKACCVIGVPDDLIGDAAGALVLLNPDCHITEKEILDYVVKRLPVETKHLHAGVRFVDRLPFNANGKFMRKQGLEMFLAK